jgi:hypothetical protein
LCRNVPLIRSTSVRVWRRIRFILFAIDFPVKCDRVWAAHRVAAARMLFDRLICIATVYLQLGCHWGDGMTVPSTHTVCSFA